MQRIALCQQLLHGQRQVIVSTAIPLGMSCGFATNDQRRGSVVQVDGSTQRQLGAARIAHRFGFDQERPFEVEELEVARVQRLQPTNRVAGESKLETSATQAKT